MSTVYITTSDNPYSPEKDYLSWHNFDMQKGYFSAEYLDRIYEKNLDLKKKNKNFDFSEIDEKILEDSIDEIIEMQKEMQKQTNSKDSDKFNVKYVKIVRKN